MKTYYDELNLSKDCTAKEIRAAFIDLSKRYHPDVNKNAGAHQRFVQINQAYSVLGNESNRRAYDRSLTMGHRSPGYQTARSTTENSQYYHQYHNQYHQYYQYYQQRTHDHGKANFTSGIHYMLNKTKVTVFLCCCILLVIGSGMHSRESHRQNIVRTRVNAYILAKTEEEAKHLGRDKVLQMMLDGTYKTLSYSEAKKELAKMDKQAE